MDDLGLILIALVFGFIFFWGPHTKSKEKKEDKKGGDKGEKEEKH